ncbi:MAG: SGNH/GDSL hydrolase family protein [Flavobacteriales bacterium]|nr:SGNH/GDSL hydrolase family protein [Flavobacteriales bacterium]
MRSLHPLTAGTNHNKLFCQYDSALGWSKIPNFLGVHIGAEYSVEEQINSQGIRGPEYSIEKKRDEYRILILGDSFAEGYMVEFNELFSQQLKNRLSKEYPDRIIEVINAGTGGYSTDQELLWLEQQGINYAPDLVVLMFYQNDIWFNSQGWYYRGYKPFFNLKNDTLTLQNVTVPKPDLSNENGQSLLKELEIFKRGQIVASKLKYHLTKSQFPNPLKNAIQTKNIPSEYSVYRKVGNSEVQNAWETTRHLLAKMKQLTDSIGSELLVFYVNPREELYPVVWENMQATYALADTTFSVSTPRAKLDQVCSHEGLLLYDATTDLKHARDSIKELNEMLFYTLDGHWNPIGNAIVGELLQKKISAEYIAIP